MELHPVYKQNFSTEIPLDNKNIAIGSFDAGSAFGESDGLIFYFVQIVLNGIVFLVCLMGLITNLISIVTFYEIGVSDSVTITFFCLSLSDLFACSFEIVKSSLQLAHSIIIEQNVATTVDSISVVFIFLRNTFRNNTIVITSFLALQRCLCVLLPFKVKAIFRKTRTSVSMTIIFVYNITIGVAHVSRRIEFRPDPVTNSTMLVIQWLSGPFDFFVIQIQTFVMKTIAPCLMVVCVVIMAISLKRSIKFHENSTSKSSNLPNGRQGPKEQSKETMAIIQVTLVSAIFVMTTIPIVFVSVVRAVIPEFSRYGKYHSVYTEIITACSLAAMVNSSVNFFVYFRYNSKFKQSLMSWCKSPHKAT